MPLDNHQEVAKIRVCEDVEKLEYLHDFKQE